MSISRTLLGLSSKQLVGIVALSSLLSAWAMILELRPQADYFLEKIQSSYDSLVPEISIKNGKASIRERQPHYLSSSTDKDVTIVIDTRDKKQREAYEYIKETPYGIAISQDFLVLKNHDQLSELSFKTLPDIVINSSNLLSALNEYSSKIWLIAWTFFIFYCLLNKTAQVCLFAFIPIIITRRLSCPVTYSEAMRFTAGAMILPVVIDFIMKWLSIFSSLETVVYFGIYALALFRIIKDHVRMGADDPSVSTSIDPGV